MKGCGLQDVAYKRNNDRTRHHAAGVFGRYGRFAAPCGLGSKEHRSGTSSSNGLEGLDLRAPRRWRSRCELDACWVRH